MLFQGSALFDSLTVEKNVMFPLNMFTNDTTAQKLKRVNEVLDRVNLVGANKKYPAELSGGMKKEWASHARSYLIPNTFFAMSRIPDSIPKHHLSLTGLSRR